MSQNRGKALHREFPRWLTQWWPLAEACPPGRNGRDVDGVPGVAFEIKSAGVDNLRPNQWIDQARRNAGHDLPVVVYYPQSVGIGSPDKAIGMLPLSNLIELLRQAGYA